MIDVPPHSDNHEVICYVKLPDGTAMNGNTVHHVKGAQLGPSDIDRFIVVRHYNDDAFYLFYCNRGWNAVTDTWRRTVEDAKNQATFEFGILDSHWETPNGTRTFG